MSTQDLRDLMTTREVHYYGARLFTEPSDRRAARYELAAKAMFFADRAYVPKHLPTPLGLIHGSWYGLDGQQGKPTAHPWVRLDDGRVWEPETAGIYDSDVFHDVTGAEPEMIYNQVACIAFSVEYRHYGPWGGGDPRG